MIMYGPPVKTVEQVCILAEQKRSIINRADIYSRPSPCAFLQNRQARNLYNMLRQGDWCVYQKSERKPIFGKPAEEAKETTDGE